MSDLDKRLRAIYSRANRELTEKVNSFFRAFEEADKKHKALVDEGKLSEKDYQKWRINTLMTGERYKQMQKDVADTLLNVNKVAASYINAEMPGVYASNFNRVGKDASKQVPGYSFDLVSAQTVRKLASEDKTLLPYKYVDGRKDERWNTKKVNGEILQGIIQGESIPKIAKRLGNVTEMNKESAIRNARTAITGAQNSGRFDGMKQLEDDGVILKKEWVAAVDSHTREAHLELNGQQVDIDEPFVVDGKEIMFPGDPDCPYPELVYNCRCTMRTVVVGFKPQSTGKETFLEPESETTEEQETVSFVEPVHVSRPIVQGEDISDNWKRRPDEFQFEIQDVMNAQGFDKLPQLVGQEEFDKAVEQSHFIAQRTYSAPDQETLDAYRDMLYNGEWYVDCSTGGAQYGQGMYCAADYTGTLTDGIKNEMEHYRDLGESRYGDAQKEYAEKVYQEEMDKVDFPLDDRYKNAFTDEMGITDMWTRGSEERQFIKDWISKNTAEANKLKEAYEKAQEIGAQKGMEIESLTREQFKEKYPNVGARSYTETLTLAPDAKVVTWREINDIRMGNLDMEYRTREIEKIVVDQGFTRDEETFVRYNLGTGISWKEVDAAAKRIAPERQDELIDAFNKIGEEATRRYNEEHERRRELAQMYRETYHDIGSLATALGYDAINAEGHGESGSYTVILNRTKCIILNGGLKK